MALSVVETAPYEVLTDEYTVWQQGNLLAGNTLPGWSEDWEENLQSAVRNLAAYTTAKQVVRISPTRYETDFIDLDTAAFTVDPHHPVRAEDVVTTNPDVILFANPADCGEIAVHGVREDGISVIGLFHASQQRVAGAGYLRNLDRLIEKHNITPEDLTVRLSPSARAESYAFPEIHEVQKSSARWKGYVRRDEQGMWHVDFHGRMIADLEAFGIPAANMAESTDDTAHSDSPYFSYSQFKKGIKQDGGNGLLFALRS